MHEERVIGVDLGGTKILAGVVARDGTIGRTIEIATPEGSQEQVLRAIDGVVDDLLHDGAVAIGYGVPLNIDRRTGVALRAMNLPAARGPLPGSGPRAVRRCRQGSRTTATRPHSPNGDSGKEGARPT